MIQVFEVGTGGGSIASLDERRAFRVGPESAGASPGPACYARGGAFPTVTDANLVLGRLDCDHFLGGEMKLDLEASTRALHEHLANPLGISVIEAAEGILRIATNSMSHTVKKMCTERGLDAATFSLIGYGGAGPLHAAAVAREIGIERLIIPQSPGHFCAFGMLFSDLRYDYIRTWFAHLGSASFDEMSLLYEFMVNQGTCALRSTGIDPAQVIVQRAADMRYVGQEHAVTIELPPNFFADPRRDLLKKLFDTSHFNRYGTSAPNEPVEIVNLHATVFGLMRKPSLTRIAGGDRVPIAGAKRGNRDVHFPGMGKVTSTPVFLRAKLLAGNRIDGPVLIEEHASTSLVLPGDELEVDEFGNLLIEICGDGLPNL